MEYTIAIVILNKVLSVRSIKKNKSFFFYLYSSFDTFLKCRSTCLTYIIFPLSKKELFKHFLQDKLLSINKFLYESLITPLLLWIILQGTEF